MNSSISSGRISSTRRWLPSAKIGNSDAIRIKGLKDLIAKEAPRRNDHPQSIVMNNGVAFGTGTNNTGILVEPLVVKFAGFEARKLNVFRVRLTNVTAKPLRVQIFSPHTQFFAVKYDKKPQILSGATEELYVHFTPNEYKYHFDQIRIHVGDDPIILPIHGYPSLTRDNLRDLFPRLLDFGSVDVGAVEIRKFTLATTIPVNFPFEFRMVRTAPAISIIPSQGTVPGKGRVEIIISYAPTQEVVSVCETELFIDQFDFDPLPIRIVGLARTKYQQRRLKRRQSNRFPEMVGEEVFQDPVPVFPRATPATSPLAESLILTTDRIAELRSNTSRQMMRKGSGFLKIEAPQTLKPPPLAEPLPRMGSFRSLVKEQRSFRINEASQPSQRSRKGTMRESGFLRASFESGSVHFAKRNEDQDRVEKDWLTRFENIAAMDKEKEYKFFVCLGDEQVTKGDMHRVSREREEYHQLQEEKIYEKAASLYHPAFNRDLPVISQVIPHNKSTWLRTKNDIESMKKLILRRALRVSSLKIVQMRADRRLLKIKNYLRGARTREEVTRIVALDWARAERLQAAKYVAPDFLMEFESKNISQQQIFPIQFESQTNSNVSTYKYDVNPRLGFDDLTHLNPVPQNDAEVYGYRNFENVSVLQHPPIEYRKMRYDCEEEYAFLSDCGPPELILENEEIAAGLPKYSSKPPEFTWYKYEIPHLTLRPFLSLDTVSDIDPQSKFIPDEIPFADILGISEETCEDDIDLQNVLCNAPGYDGLRSVAWISNDKRKYYHKILGRAPDYAFEENMERYCPEMLIKQEWDDVVDGVEEKPPSPLYKIALIVKTLAKDCVTMFVARSNGLLHRDARRRGLLHPRET